MVNGKIIKVCGMREAENIQEIESLQDIDMLGFIFYPKSPRYVYELPAYLPIHTHRVGVFVNEDKQIVSMFESRAAGTCFWTSHNHTNLEAHLVDKCNRHRSISPDSFIQNILSSSEKTSDCS